MAEIVFQLDRAEPDLPSVRMSIDEDITADQLLSAFREFMLAVGYHPASVQNAIDAEASDEGYDQGYHDGYDEGRQDGDWVGAEGGR
jgi:hypothetical protein